MDSLSPRSATAAAPEEYTEADAKLKDAFFAWLLHSIKGDRANNDSESRLTSRQWDQFWNEFSSEGNMDWPTFARAMRSAGKLAPKSRRIFELLSLDTGVVTAHTMLEERRLYERQRAVHKHKGVADLRKILQSQFGTMTRAWSLALDPAHNGFCNQTQFIKACKANGYTGDLKGCWEELTGRRGGKRHCESNSITYGDIDPENDELLLSFVRCFIEHYGDLADGWYSMLSAVRDKSEGGATQCLSYVFPKEFVEGCMTLGFTSKQAKTVFRLLDIDSGADKLTQPEFAFLEMWERRVKSADEHADAPQALDVSGRPSPRAGAEEREAQDFIVIMTREEHEEYVRRLKSRDVGSSGVTGVSSSKATARGIAERKVEAREAASRLPGASWATALPPANRPQDQEDSQAAQEGYDATSFAEVLRQLA